MNYSLTTILRKRGNVVFRKIEDECILVPLAGSVADVRSIFCLNETGAAVWGKIDGSKSIGEIIAEMRAEYDIDNLPLEPDVMAFITEMTSSKLLDARPL